MTFAQIYDEKLKANGGNRPMDWMAQMAQFAAISVDSIYLYATGWRKPHPAAAKLLSIALDTPAEELFPLTFGKARLAEEAEGKDDTLLNNN